MYLSIIILPFLGSIISGFLGRKIGIKGSQFISCLCLFLSAILSTFAFYEVGICASPVSILVGNWIDSEIMQVSWEFLFDQLSVVFCIMITYITFLILVYTVYYMEGQPQSVLGKRDNGDKLSNSGDVLKVKVPSHSRKIMSGWINYSGMVTSLNMSENKMDNRGSKSISLPEEQNIVKEQRADGSWCIKKGYIPLMHLRCALMGCESSYIVKIPSKQLNSRSNSTLSNTNAINPWFWTGLIDAEGSFSVIIDKNKVRNLGWRVQSKFQMGLHMRDFELLLKLQQYFNGIGSIYMDNSRNRAMYSVDSNKDLKILIDHFEKYPLLTQKAGDWILFRQVVELMNNKLHLTIEGLHQIVNIKASMNLGLSDMLKSEFNLITPVNRPVTKTEKIPDPNWIAGFVNGEGNFDVKIYQARSDQNKTGYLVQLRFRITQHIRDLNLMELIISELGTGWIYKYPNGNAVTITVSNFADITNIIVPFFERYPIIGVKLYDYLDWCQVQKLIHDRLHLTTEGLNLIRKIKSGMNTGRVYNNI